jgi:chromosomal replication initiator protein
MNDLELRESTVKEIQEAVAHLFGLSTEELRAGSSRHDVALPRQIAMYLVKQMTDASLPEIGRHFGGRHHTTVMHSIAKIHKLRSSEAELDHAVRKLLTSLASR